MINEETLRLLEGIYQAAYRCIIYTNYYELITADENKENHFWIAAQNTFGDEACLNWAKIFGSPRESTHFTEFFTRQDIIAEGFSKKDARNRILSTVCFNKTDYIEFHKNVLACRNKLVAHTEIDSKILYPDLKICRKMSEELLAIFEDLVRRLLPDNENIKCFEAIMNSDLDNIDFNDINFSLFAYRGRLNASRNLYDKCSAAYKSK